ncbi:MULTISPECIES: helix-turn-helix transcriptional regulator [unclassified Streptomyces]|uniref:Scr1 family TA system antitoxin-like transcriptional regulator n=1 Tax=unclassified Streptomyces TaxID=2593676 RepID=UPI0013715F20|nr:helix-turn-helix domain-containing protein [Streptomyces sp. SID6139]MYR23274.1 helix-turn-helix domain-containing protein [Streptomyces sp. SID6137]
MSEEAQEDQDGQEAPGSGIPLVFGRVLKRLRVQAGMERAELGRRTGYSAATITSYEVGRRIPNAKFIRQADEVLGAGGLLIDFIEDMERAQYPTYFRDAAALEKQAVALHVFAVQAVPGLLQTEEYAQAVFTMWRPMLDEETIEQRVAARLARQEIFTRKPAPTVTFVMEEAVVRRQLGGLGVWRGQLEQILLVGQRRNVEIQVMPYAREEHAALSGNFTLIETGKGRRIAYVPAYKVSRLVTDRSTVREVEEKYGLLRAQALPPRESLAFVEKLLGET